MKWIGFLILTAAGVAIGFAAWGGKKTRLALLVSTERLLRDWERRLQFAAMPVRDWLKAVAVQPQYAQLTFLNAVLQRLEQEDLETAWRTALPETRGLSAEDVAVLCSLGAHLGKSDTATQLGCVQQALSALSENRKQAATEAEKAGKLYVGLGTCAGMAVALLLV